jgi:WD40 repeat protein
MAEPSATEHPTGPDHVSSDPTVFLTPPLTEGIPVPGARPVVPGYTILDVLGRGGMGVVYKALQGGLNRLVALKMILTGEHAGPQELARFRREAEAVAHLRHPHIVQIYEVGQHDGRPFFSLEYAEGGSLAGRLDGTPQPARETASLVETLAQAVQVAHDAGIIHRDLKPANVLLSFSREPRASAGEALARGSRLNDFVPKISDFGLAKRLTGEGGASATGGSPVADAPGSPGYTPTGAVLGTPSYMAPEQAGGVTRQLGPGCDIYSLGGILYELLTGRPPFQGESVLDTLQLVLTQDPVPVRRLQPRVPRDLETICLRCLQKEPRKRYASARELADELGRFLRGEPIRARPIGRGERLWRWCRRNPALAVAGGLALAGGALAIVLSISFAVYQSQAAENLRRALALAEDREGLAQRRAAALHKEQRATKAALTEAQRERDRAGRRLAENHLRQAQAACETNADPAHGMLLLCRALEVWPANAVDLRRVIRANLAGWRREIHALEAILEQPYLVSAVGFSRDGKVLLTRCAKFLATQGEARLWEGTSGRPLGPPLPHPGGLQAATLSPDSRSVVTGGADGKVRRWSVPEGRLLGEPLVHPKAIYDVTISPDGQTLAVACADQTVWRWDVASGKPRGKPLAHPHPVGGLAFSPDSQTLAVRCVAYQGSGDVRLWDVASGKPVGKPLAHKGGVGSMAFSPDGRAMLTGGNDNTAQLWSVATGAAVGPALPHGGIVNQVAFRPDGRVLLTGCSDGAVRLWDRTNGRPVGRVLWHRGSVMAVAFSPDGQTILTGSYDRMARLWDTVSGLALGPPLRHNGLVTAVAFSPDGRRIVTGGWDNQARLWRRGAGPSPDFPLPHASPIFVVAISPNGKLAVTGSGDGTARLWDVATGRPLGGPLKQTGAIQAVAFSRDSRLLLTGGGDSLKKTGEARLWDTATGRAHGPPLRHRFEVHAVAFAPDGRAVLTGSGDDIENFIGTFTNRPGKGEAQLWDVVTGKPLGPALKHKAGVHAVSFSPDGRTLLSGGHDQTAQLWDRATGRAVGKRLHHGGLVNVAVFSPGGRLVVTGGNCGIRLWDTATGKPLGPLIPHLGTVQAAVFSPDGKIVLTGGGEPMQGLGGARLWDVTSGRPRGPYLRHASQVVAVGFSSDGRIALTGSWDWTVRLWDVATGWPLGPPLRYPGQIRGAALSPDGGTVLVGGFSPGAAMWRVWRPLAGGVRHVQRGVEVQTGLELDEHGDLRMLGGSDWQRRRQGFERPPRQVAAAKD